jgi:hypothetical protein
MEARARRLKRLQRFETLWLISNQGAAPYAVYGKSTGAPKKLPRPFPEADVAMEWPVIKDILDTDVTIPEMEDMFQEEHDLVQEALSEWRAEFQRTLADRLRGSRTSEEEIAADDKPLDGMCWLFYS